MSQRVFVTLFAVAAMLPRQAVCQPSTVASKPTPAITSGAWNPPRTLDGQPDLQGIWDNGTVTSMERPEELAGKEFFTPQEALAWEKEVVARVNRDQRTRGTVQDVSRAYNDVWWDSGTKVVRTLRTSMVIHPPDGKIPPLTPKAQDALRTRIAKTQRPAEKSSDRPLTERCLQFPTSGPPMVPYVYDNNFRIVQTKEYVRRTPASAIQCPAVVWRLGGSLGRQHAGGGHDKFQQQNKFSRIGRQPARNRAFHPHGPRYHRVSLHHRRSDGLHEAMDR
jgi:hypothetical protein